jgi:hypothetical protein
MLYILFFSFHCFLSLSILKYSESSQKEILRLLKGRFSNLKQANAAAAVGKDTAAKGGHEHITVYIDSITDRANVLCAQYFYGTDVSQTFRFRIYEFPRVENFGTVCMRIHRLYPEAEARLASLGYNTEKFLPVHSDDLEYLPNCDIKWTPCVDSMIKNGLGSGIGYHGRLQSENAIFPSQRDPNRLLVVYDDLIITDSKLFINDRIFDQASGKQIIGNTEGI